MAKRKRKRGTGTIYHRKDGRWEGRYIVGYKKDGKPIFKSVHANSKKECDRRLKEVVQSVQTKGNGLRKAPIKVSLSMTFGEWLDYWYQNKIRPHLRVNTCVKYENNIYRHLIPKLGDIPIAKITTGQLQVFFNDMRLNGRLANRETYGPELSPQTVHSCYILCKSALEQAVREYLLPLNPAVGCKLASQKATEMQVLTQEEMQRLLIQANAEGFYVLFLMDLSTGLRRGELLGLRWTDLDFKTGILKIDKQAYPIHGKISIAEPKTKSSNRSIILPPALVDLLKARKQESCSEWIFPSSLLPEQPYDPSFLNKKFHQILERSGCKKIRFHDLRHTFATMSLEHGMDIKTLSTIIGHASASTTLNIYSHTTDNMKRDAARKIDRQITGAEASNAIHSDGGTLPRKQDFKPVQGQRRRKGTGSIHMINSHTWEGRYSLVGTDGKRHYRHVYADTEEECEAKLAVLIQEIKAEIRERKATKTTEPPSPFSV